MIRVVAIAFALALVPFVVAAQDTKKKPSPEAVKELNTAYRLLRVRKGRAQGIEKLREVIAKYPGDPAAEKAAELLRENGVGDGIQVELIDSATFKRFGLPEKAVLELGEKALEDISGHFKALKPYYSTNALSLVFYDSQARYRKETGNIHYSGHFSVKESSDKERSLVGEIVWHFPQQAGSAKDRLTRVKSVVCHETAHFISAVHFARTVPPAIEEGLAKYFECLLSTDYYQAYRGTEREFTESSARNGLNSIAKYGDFEKFLDSPRGFGQAGRMLDRWYGFCYALVDFIDRGEIGSRRSSVGALLRSLSGRAAALKRAKGSPPSGKTLMAELAVELYGSDLKAFHEALIEHVTGNYRQL